VGRRAQDNDLLSCSPQHREETDAWLHAAHCPGSHVIIRLGGRPISSLSETVILDAAALAARYSKAWKMQTETSCSLPKTSSVIPVHLTLCQNVQKPRGAPPGLVQIMGPCQTLTISATECLDRWIRLNATLDLEL
jgi:predicted ribosome quality control (RQC) complex YloA/Tae2 family protein